MITSVLAKLPHLHPGRRRGVTTALACAQLPRKGGSSDKSCISNPHLLLVLATARKCTAAPSCMLRSSGPRSTYPCWEKVSTTVSPRFLRISLLPSARSAAELDAMGYSPPTPTPTTQKARHILATFTKLSHRRLQPG